VNRREATQYVADGIGILPGALLDFEQPERALCVECGGLVNLTSEITVVIQEEDGSKTEQKMTEANARALLQLMDIAPPPVLCDWHEELLGTRSF